MRNLFFVGLSMSDKTRHGVIGEVARSSKEKSVYTIREAKAKTLISWAVTRIQLVCTEQFF